MSLPIGRSGGLLKSIQNNLPTRTGRRRTNRFRDGTKFGPKKMFIASSFDLEKWANRRGYGLEHMEKLHKSGVLEKILIGGAKGAQWQWYDNTTGWDRQTTTRIGAIATKVGMKMEQDFWGRAHPVTLLQLKDNQVRLHANFLVSAALGRRSFFLRFARIFHAAIKCQFVSFYCEIFIV
jgi:hypothetical protein